MSRALSMADRGARGVPLLAARGRRAYCVLMRLAAILLALQASMALAGDKWIALTPDGARMGRVALAADPFAPQTLYADVYPSGAMAKSTDAGQSWTLLPLKANFVTKILVERAAPNRVTAFSSETPGFSLHRSVDGGITWTVYRPTAAVSGTINDLAIDPMNGAILYMAHGHVCTFGCIADSGGISKSTDRGAHWTALFKGVHMEQVLVDPFDSATVYAAGYPASRRSENSGQTWSDLAAPGGGTIFRMALDPVVPNVVYASSFYGFWRSDDRGNTWHLL